MTDTGLSQDFRALSAVAAGGILGALARWALVEAFPDPSGWPWAIFVVNVVGSLVLGVLSHNLLRQRSVPLHLAASTGFCGALTTFSGFAVDTAGFLRDNRTGLAILYALVSVAAGLAAVLIGRGLANKTAHIQPGAPS